MSAPEDSISDKVENRRGFRVKEDLGRRGPEHVDGHISYILVATNEHHAIQRRRGVVWIEMMIDYY